MNARSRHDADRKIDRESAPPRVVVFISTIKAGGAEKVAVMLANGLARRGHDVTLVMFRLEGFYTALLDPDIAVVKLRPHTPTAVFRHIPILRALPVWLALVAYLREFKPVAVFPSLNICNILSLAASLLVGGGTRYYPTICDNLVQQRRHAAGIREKAVVIGYHLAYRLLLPRAEKVVSVSHGIAADLIRLFALDERQIEVIDRAPVVDEKFMQKRQVEPDHPWLRSKDCPVLVAVGRLYEVKDYPTMLRAFAIARRERPLRLIVLGRGRQEVELRKLARDLGIADAVDFPGFEMNPYAFLRRCDAYVLSSRWECLPTALIEALACGARAVSTRCPHGPEEILEGGKWGRLTPVGDAEAMAHAILEALETPKNTEVSAHFCRRHSVDAYAGAYASLVFRDRPSG